MLYDVLVDSSSGPESSEREKVLLVGVKGASDYLPPKTGESNHMVCTGTHEHITQHTHTHTQGHLPDVISRVSPGDSESAHMWHARHLEYCTFSSPGPLTVLVDRS